MPKLPEVETVKRVLAPYLTGREILAVIVNHEKIIAHPKADELCEKHTHLMFALDNGQELRYEDTRRFGKFWLFENGEEDAISGIHKLGLEPFSPVLSAEYLQAKPSKRKKPIKEMLMDQSVIAGIGNIYSDEILFTAKIRPDKLCNRLTSEELRTLSETIRERLAYFIDRNHITFEEYTIGKGKNYRNTPYLQVYGKGGSPCAVCGGILRRSAIGGRSSVFCEHCQKI